MQKIIIIKYGELTTKKDNINYFLKTLRNNVDKKLDTISHEITYDFGRMFVRVDEDSIDKCISLLKEVFGIFEIIVGYKDNLLEIEDIKKNVLSLIKDMEFKTFKIKTKRSNKKYPLDSMQISQNVGSYILKNIDNIKVDVHNPELLFEIEIRKDEVLYYYNGIKGLGGYPVGTLGKGLLMLSGGIDSPVAGYLTIKRGVSIEAIYFESPPHTSLQAKNKVIELTKKLATYNGSIKLHIIGFTKIQEEILKNIDHDYLITIMRRMMYRISQRIALHNNCHILINGESIGQVASQTLTSMQAINSVVKIPVIRPIACFDKLEIIDIAKRINTYDISILPYEDCCTIFVPTHPVINPKEDKCIEFEKNINVEQLINEVIKNHEVVIIDENFQKNNYNDLL